MADLAIIVPTRGRPDRFAELVTAVHATATGDVTIWAGLDDDDPTAADYLLPIDLHVFGDWGPRRLLSPKTNLLAERALASADPPRYLASLGDDHRPRTPGWDRILIDAIEKMDGPGFAYGNDLFQGRNMCTAWVVSAEIVRVLGWMMLPTCQHIYVDAAILALGEAAGRIVYRPDVIIEHVHPLAGKTSWDDSYRDSNSQARYAADERAYDLWRNGGGLASDLQHLLAIKENQHAGT